ncbi:hypothetical protein P3X46_034159 [Hevea brasiliensis]|uniref:Uncharacterized protein n=1 Tax=Hevea brasiliensis TaxID=3981 RepID=A0ABQ9KD87_HEVBR|nr:uncharacterized protein LOC110632507 [Hevea brasiliensis]KAJ9130712.1 hypothetical protein P3X46_034159 [Hevea brasiliensis]
MAGGYFPSIKMKRKELDDVSDDFSDFSLSSPARKIRRLDAELPPIMEEEEADIHPMVGVTSGVEGEAKDLSSGLNQEKAIVVFKPVHTNPLLHSSSNFSVSVDSNFFSGFKNQFPWMNRTANIELVEEEEGTNECMAVVPWVPSQFPIAQDKDISQAESPELMEAEQVGEATMDIEENTNETIEQEHGNEFNEFRGTQGLPQWQQQHCMMPLPPQNTSTPITWFH